MVVGDLVRPEFAKRIPTNDLTTNDSRPTTKILSGVQLDDQMFLHRRINLIPRREGHHPGSGLVGLVFQPCRGSTVGRPLQEFFNPGRFLALVPDGDNITDSEQIATQIVGPALKLFREVQ